MRLRNVEEPDLEVFFEQQLDPEAARLANFPSRDRERFITHWATKVLGDPTVFVQTVTVDGEPAGSVVAWWDQTGASSVTGSDARSGGEASAPEQ